MFRNMLLAAVMFAGAGSVVADEKDAKPGTGGPPPGKGWRKNEVAVAPQPKYAPTPKPAPTAVKPPAPVPAPKKPDGIGSQVAAWAKSGIHGRQLAAMIHQLQAVRAKQQPTTPPPTVKPKKGQPEVAQPPTINPKKPKKDGKKGQDDEQG